MKKTLNIFSILTTILIILGSLFKFMHWPGAGPFLILSMGLLSLGFIPVYAKSKLKELNGWKIKFTVGLGYFCLSALNLGILFKVMHWPFAGLLILAGLAFFSLFFLPTYSIHKMRHSANKAEKIMNLTGGLSLSFIILGLLFKLNHWPGSALLLVLGVFLLLFLSIPFLLIAYKADPALKTDKLLRLTFMSVLGTTFIAFMFNNTSKVFLNSFAAVQEKVEETSGNINMRNENLLASIQGDTDKLTVKQKAEKVHELTNNVCQYINDLKSHLISSAEGMSKEEADSLSPYDINTKDNYDIPTRILIGDVENPREGSFSGEELKNKIMVYKEDILGMVSEEEKLKLEKIIGLTLEDKYSRDYDKKVKWQVWNFNYVPISGALTILAQIQNKVRLAENDVLTSLNEKATTVTGEETSK